RRGPRGRGGRGRAETQRAPRPRREDPRRRREEPRTAALMDRAVPDRTCIEKISIRSEQPLERAAASENHCPMLAVLTWCRRSAVQREARTGLAEAHRQLCGRTERALGEGGGSVGHGRRHVKADEDRGVGTHVRLVPCRP